MSESNQTYIGSFPTRNRIHDMFIITIGSIFIDRAIGVFFWSHEANPLVLSLGIEKWLGITAVMVAALWFGWYYLELYQYRIFRLWYLSIAAIHTLIAIANLAVVYL